MESFAINLPGKLGENRSAESDALTREILQHRDEEKNRSYLSRLVVGATESFHGNSRSLEHLDALRQDALLAKMAGNSSDLEAVQKKASSAISDDQEARQSASTWSSHAGNFLKSTGMFFPGKAGYAMAAFANAADSAHPADSYYRQGIDGALGAGKGALLKFGVEKIAASEMNLALKAGALSLSSRFAEVGLDSHTYFDEKTGDFSPLGGLYKTGRAMFDPRQLGMDMLTFGGGCLLLNKLGVNAEFARSNPLIAQTLTGAGFGFSSGFFSDLQAQSRLGDGFNMEHALRSAVIQAGLDGTAAALGGLRMRSALQANTEFSPRHERSAPMRLDDSVVDGVYGLDNRPVARLHSRFATEADILEGLAIQESLDSKPATTAPVRLDGSMVDGVYGLDNHPVATPHSQFAGIVPPYIRPNGRQVPLPPHSRPPVEKPAPQPEPPPVKKAG